MIDGKYFLDQPIKNDLKTYENIRKISPRQVDDTQPDVYQIIPILKNTIN